MNVLAGKSGQEIIIVITTTISTEKKITDSISRVALI